MMRVNAMKGHRKVIRMSILSRSLAFTDTPHIAHLVILVVVVIAVCRCIRCLLCGKSLDIF